MHCLLLCTHWDWQLHVQHYPHCVAREPEFSESRTPDMRLAKITCLSPIAFDNGSFDTGGRDVGACSRAVLRRTRWCSNSIGLFSLITSPSVAAYDACVTGDQSQHYDAIDGGWGPAVPPIPQPSLRPST